MTDYPVLKFMVYTDGGEASVKALHFSARLALKLNVELAVITVQAGTHAIEALPPIGVDFPLEMRKDLPSGIQALVRALDVLTEEGVFNPPSTIKIRELAHGNMFVKETRFGKRVPFYLYYGDVIEMFNREIDRDQYHLLIMAPPADDVLKKMLKRNFARKLILDLHTSVFIVRGGGPDDRYLICSDDSAAARRQFPLVRQLLPAIGPPLELICVETPDRDEKSVQEASHCLEQAEKWLETCGRQVKVHRPHGKNPVDIIGSIAGDNSVIIVGASLRHDIYRRFVGSLPTKILEQTASSLLVVKQQPESEDDIFQACELDGLNE